jgi:hypothetical protein
MTIQSKTLLVAAQIFISTATFASYSNPQVNIDPGRIVIFTDLQAGHKKSDIALKKGTNRTLELLAQVSTHQEIHTCFRGSSEMIRPILGELVTNTNNANANQDLKLKSFSTVIGQHETIHFEITSESAEDTAMALTLEPC